MDACAAMGEHRREHTRERSDGQAQMAECGSATRDALRGMLRESDLLFEHSRSFDDKWPRTVQMRERHTRRAQGHTSWGNQIASRALALLMTKRAPASSGSRPFPHQAAGISSASSRAGRFPKLDPWQTLRV